MASLLERTNEVRLEAKTNGVKFGRKRTVDRERVHKLSESGLGAATIAKELGIGRSTIYKILKES